MNRYQPRMLRWLAAMALIFPTFAAVADTPGGIADILYQDTGWGSDQLRSRGYTQTSSYRSEGDGTPIQYWWQGASNTCVRASAGGGKYQSMAVTSPTDCGQYHEQATKNNNAAATAVAAAAILGAVALAHKSHERNERHEDSQSIAEFDRGYRDGIHHERYHNRNNQRAYSDGYNAGQRERDNQTSYRSDSGHHSGYQPYVSLDDLRGARAASADSTLQSRGFSAVGGYKQGNKSYGTWYNGRTHQCAQVVTQDGRILDVEAINEGNCT